MKRSGPIQSRPASEVKPTNVGQTRWRVLRIMGTMVRSLPVRMIREILPGNIERRLSGVS